MGARDMVARNSQYAQTKDYIPTPGYATRVLYEEVAPEMLKGITERTVLDPACGAGHMCEVFHEYNYKSVVGSDLIDYPDKRYKMNFVKEDFMDPNNTKKYDDIVTNPPYALLGDFTTQGLDRAENYFAMLLRVQALESQSRFKIFSRKPPTRIGFFSDRIPFKSGYTTRKAPKMFFHIWLFWDIKRSNANPRDIDPPTWIKPNAQELYEKLEDYDVI